MLKNVLHAESRKHLFQKNRHIVHVVKNWTEKREDGGCNACVEDLGRSRAAEASFSRARVIEKVAAHNGNRAIADDFCEKFSTWLLGGEKCTGAERELAFQEAQEAERSRTERAKER